MSSSKNEEIFLTINQLPETLKKISTRRKIIMLKKNTRTSIPYEGLMCLVSTISSYQMKIGPNSNAEIEVKSFK